MEYLLTEKQRIEFLMKKVDGEQREKLKVMLDMINYKIKCELNK